MASQQTATVSGADVAAVGVMVPMLTCRMISANFVLFYFALAAHATPAA